MTQRKPRNTTPRDEQIAAILARARAALADLFADLGMAPVSLDERDTMEELACWKRMRADVPAWCRLLRQHGF